MSKIIIPIVMIALILLIRGIAVSYNVNREVIPKIEKPPEFVSQTANLTPAKIDIEDILSK